MVSFLEAQGLLGFHRAEAGRLFELAEALEGCGAPWTGGRELLDLGARLKSLAQAPELPAPAVLRGELRPYQRAGYGWLTALSDGGFGGVLADDMGLGKTVQTLALLAHRHVEEKVPARAFWWFRRAWWATGNGRPNASPPDLKLLVLHGPDRWKRFGEIPRRHLVVTTYGLLNRDHEELFRHDYDTAVLDEAQAVKNPAAGISKRVREIRARQRLALTGTPIENNLQELWSLYDWLIPGLLGNRKSFTAAYRTPIEKRGDGAKQRLLSTRIKPFLMRRTKEQVARELPEKTVIDEIIPLEGAQAALYESIRTAMDKRVREAIAARGLAASRIAILDALLKLRQVCCDPRLVRLDAARKVTESAKRSRMLALLEELVAEGRRILIFSQFVKMLKLLERDVAARGWDYAMLHGGTRDRDAQVSRFQSGNLPLFLVSLKAGGTGLNLTAADTVIVYDPWWNPAVERQAMDRAHRIGQDKPVFVHRLIAENTVEAAIQRMQARKQALADALFEGTGHGPLALTEKTSVRCSAPYDGCGRCKGELAGKAMTRRAAGLFVHCMWPGRERYRVRNVTKLRRQTVKAPSIKRTTTAEALASPYRARTLSRSLQATRAAASDDRLPKAAPLQPSALTEGAKIGPRRRVPASRRVAGSELESDLLVAVGNAQRRVRFRSRSGTARLDRALRCALRLPLPRRLRVRRLRRRAAHVSRLAALCRLRFPVRVDPPRHRGRTCPGLVRYGDTPLSRDRLGKRRLRRARLPDPCRPVLIPVRPLRSMPVQERPADRRRFRVAPGRLDALASGDRDGKPLHRRRRRTRLAIFAA